MSRTMRWFVLACGLLLLAAPVFAATQNAVVYGTVYDAAGNPMAGVAVTLENPALGFSRASTTGSDGSYNFAEVPPAEGYKLTAAKGGKKLDIRSGITVNVGDERVILPPLKEQAAAATAPVVERTSEAQGVRNETVSTSISGVITGDQLRSLPSTLNRNFLSLGTLTPNTHDVEGGSELTGASFSISGTRPSTNDFLLDGSDNVASSSNQAIPFQVNDAIQEFRVTSSTASAEYGRGQGGVVNVVTRRGGNGFHGSAFGYFNNDFLNANNHVSLYNGTTFDKAAAYAGPTAATCTSTGVAPLTYNDYVNTACDGGVFTDSLRTVGANNLFDPAAILAANNKFKQPFSSKQFGINMGGALMKDKWFAFGSYEATLIDNPNQIFERVPSNFDRTFDPLGSGYTFASTLGALDPNYLIAADAMALFPAANVIAVPDALEFFRGEAPNHTTVHNILLRSDYVHSDKTTLSLRYAVQWLNQLHDDSLPEQTNYAGNGAKRDAFNQNLSFSYARTFSPTLINEVRVGFSRFNVKEKAQDAGFDATTIGTAGFNLPNSAMPTLLLNGLDTQYSGAFPGTNGAFAIWGDAAPMRPTLDYFFPMARLGAPLNTPSERRDTTWFAADSVSWSRGKHSFRFGGEFRHLDNQVSNSAFSRGFIYSSNMGEFTADSESCNGGCAGAFRRPAFDFAQTQTSPYVGNFHSYAFAGFIQDTWRFHPRWTLNVGVRYEYFSTPEEADDRIWNFDPVANGLVQQGHSATIDPYGNSCTATPPPYQSVPLTSRSPAGFGIVPGNWVCNTVGSGKIVRSDTNNWAPRVGLAWDLFGSGKTVLRFGAGWFYDHLPVSDVSQLLYNRPTNDAANPNAFQGRLAFDVGGTLCTTNLSCGVGSSIINPTVQAATTLDGVNVNTFYSAAAQPFAMYARDVAHSSTPYTRQMSASLQQQITSKLAVELGYIGTSGKTLPVVYNSNYEQEFTLFDPTVLAFDSNDIAGANVFFPVFTMTNQGASTYHSLLARARIAEFHGLRMNVTYNWSKSIDNASTGFFPTVPSTLNNFGIAYQRGLTGNAAILCLLGTAPGACVGNPLVFPGIDFSTGAVTTTGANQAITSRYLIAQDPFNFLIDDRGRSDFDSKNRFVLDYTWDVPSLQKKWGWSKWLDYWQFSGVFVAQSGQPFTVFSGPILGEINQRANILGPVAQNNSNPNAAISSTNLGFPLTDCIAAVAPSPFIISPLQPTVGTACTGDSRRNQFTGPNLINFNMAIQKGFPIGGENRMLSIRAEFYNLANRANYYNPISTLSTDGVNLNPDFGKIKSAHDPRQIQFAVRYTW